MSGELEFEDIFYGEVEVKYPVTAHIIFLCFVLLVTVILTNLMVGLAVSDIQGLQVSATLDRLVRQAELIARLESLFFSRLLSRVPTRFLKMCKRSALLRTSAHKLQFITRPNDPRDSKLPEDIKLNVYKLVAERRDRNLSLKRHKMERNYTMFHHHTLQNNCTRGNLLREPCPLLNSEQNCNNNKSGGRYCATQRNSEQNYSNVLRPKSATTTAITADQSWLLGLRNQINHLGEIRTIVRHLETHLQELQQKIDKFTDNNEQKMSSVLAELTHLKRVQLQQNSKHNHYENLK